MIQKIIDNLGIIVETIKLILDAIEYLPNII